MMNALIGGFAIGLSAVGMMYFFGKIAGVSGIVKGSFSKGISMYDLEWRLLFLFGVIVGGGGMIFFFPAQVSLPASISLWRLIPGAIFVGLGTAMANGCTSGHGVCGLGRKSGRSVVAITLFLFSAILTTYILLHVLHFAPL